jgi:hypothetical protein
MVRRPEKKIMFPNSEADYYFARECAARHIAEIAENPASKASQLRLADEYRRRALAWKNRSQNDPEG